MWKILSLLLCMLASPLGLSAAKKPQRIASGTVGTDEILWELLKNQRHRIIAISSFSEDSRYSLLGPIPAWLKGRVGTSVESLLALHPDLAILASYNRRELAPQLQAAGIPVVLQDNFKSIDAIFANILTIGDAIDQKAEAEALVDSMKEKIAFWAQKRPKCKRPTAILYNAQGTLPGRDTSFTSALEAAGFTNLTAERGLPSWAPLSHEVLISLQPDFIVVTSSPDEQNARLQQLRRDAVWSKMRAVQAGRLIYVPEALLSTVSHHVIELVELFHGSFRCAS